VDGRNSHASDGRLLVATLFEITTSLPPRFTPWKRDYCKTMVGTSMMFFEGFSSTNRRFANSFNKADGASNRLAVVDRCTDNCISLHIVCLVTSARMNTLKKTRNRAALAVSLRPGVRKRLFDYLCEKIKHGLPVPPRRAPRNRGQASVY
jgi:hypothetical protein